jgi:cytochrome c oxidase subunit 4
MEADQIAIAQSVAEQHRHHAKGQFFWVWGALLAMTGFEVYLAYQNLQPLRMLSILMGLSLIKAALIISYFMHLKFEVSRMKWLTMCSLVICLSLMCIFFFDALRLLQLGVGAR